MFSDKVTLLGIYNIMGEGLVVELAGDDQTALYDRRGLQHRIVERKKRSFDTRVEEDALRQLDSHSPQSGYHEFFSER